MMLPISRAAAICALWTSWDSSMGQEHQLGMEKVRFGGYREEAPGAELLVALVTSKIKPELR